MNNAKIYAICTRNKLGRYFLTATAYESRAEAKAAHVVEGLTADGWNLTETQTIPDAEQIDTAGPGVPVVTKVYHLRNAAGEWETVEIYRVED